MRRIGSILLVLSACAVLPASAGAASSNALKVQTAYIAHGGVIPPCLFSTAVLNDARRHITRDMLQYSPDLEEGIATALEQRAAGACDKKSKKTSSTPATTGAPATAGTNGGSGATAPSTHKSGGTASTPTSTPSTTAAPTTSTPQPAPTVNPAPEVANDAIPAAAITPPGDGADDAPAPLLVLALLLGVLLVLGALWASLRWMGFNPPWLQRWRHATSEAGWRASAAWSEFTDWVRLGR
jgi:hypothetical protein